MLLRLLCTSLAIKPISARRARCRLTSELLCSSVVWRSAATRMDSLKRAADASDPKAIVDAIGKASLDTIVGKVAFGDKNLPPFAQKNIAKTPLVGGQWRLGADGKYQIVVVDNQTAPAIPVGGKMEAIA